MTTMLRLLLLVCLAHFTVGKDITGRVLQNNNPDSTLLLSGTCTLTIQVLDVSKADAAAPVMGTQEYQNILSLPASYQVTYTPNGSPSMFHAITARITCSDGHLYLNDHRIHVPVGDNENITVDIVVIKAY